MEKVAGEFLQCPVCFEYPENEVYQCTNGHTICNLCIKGQELCPQCRVPYGNAKVRNRALETLLQNMEIDCVYGGCDQKLLRKDLGDHRAVCGFRPISFCKSVGFDYCNYANSDPDLIAIHLQEEHHVDDIPCNKPLEIVNFGFISESSKQSKQSYTQLWMAHLNNYGHQPGAYVAICLRQCTDRDDCSFDCIYFGNTDDKSDQLTVTFTILGRDQRSTLMSWGVAPWNYKLPQTFSDKFNFRISMDYLNENLGSMATPSYDLKLAVSFHKKKVFSGKPPPPPPRPTLRKAVSFQECMGNLAPLFRQQQQSTPSLECKVVDEELTAQI